MAHNLVAPKEHRNEREFSEDTTGKEVNDSSDINTVHSYSLKPSKRSRRRATRIQSGSSTSDVPSTSETPSQRSRKRKSATHSRSSTPVKPSTAANVVVEADSVNERRNLLQTPGIATQDYGSVGNSGEGTRSRFSHCHPNERFFSIMLFLFLLVLGMIFVICSNLNSDSASAEITPRVVKVYAMILITIFIAWLFCDKLINRNRIGTSDEESGALIPSHLLNGLVLFGVGSSVCQAVTIVDFMKCRRYVSGLDYSYVVYPFFEMAFMFSQIYVFYALSKNRERKILFGNAFTMFTLAVNLTIWAKYFFAGAVDSPQLKQEKWLTHFYYGVRDNDSCSGITVGENSRNLHAFRSLMMPFMYTLAMEYSLLASALLLHLWLGIARQNAGEYGAVKKTWTIWRYAFILGLLSLPLLGTMAVNASAQTSKFKIFIVYCGELFLFVMLFVYSFLGLKFVKTTSFLVDQGPVKVDVILLCMSWMGFLVFDLFTMLAASAEVLESFHGPTFGLGVVSLVELLSTGILTAFIVTAYSRKLRPVLSSEQRKGPKAIRQIGSFCVIVSFGFWAMRTYTFRSTRTYTFDFVSEEFYGSLGWFAITQLSVPLCTFYHFHSAVCFTEVIAIATEENL